MTKSIILRRRNISDMIGDMKKVNTCNGRWLFCDAKVTREEMENVGSLYAYYDDIDGVDVIKTDDEGNISSISTYINDHDLVCEFYTSFGNEPNTSDDSYIFSKFPIEQDDGSYVTEIDAYEAYQIKNKSTKPRYFGLTPDDVINYDKNKTYCGMRVCERNKNLLFTTAGGEVGKKRYITPYWLITYIKYPNMKRSKRKSDGGGGEGSVHRELVNLFQAVTKRIIKTPPGYYVIEMLANHNDMDLGNEFHYYLGKDVVSTQLNYKIDDYFIDLALLDKDDKIVFAIEIDVHHNTEAKKQKKLAELGIDLLIVKENDNNTPEMIIEKIRLFEKRSKTIDSVFDDFDFMLFVNDPIKQQAYESQFIEQIPYKEKRIRRRENSIRQKEIKNNAYHKVILQKENARRLQDRKERKAKREEARLICEKITTESKNTNSTKDKTFSVSYLIQKAREYGNSDNSYLVQKLKRILHLQDTNKELSIDDLKLINEFSKFVNHCDSDPYRVKYDYT